MLQTVATRPVVSMFADCAYCPQSTSFRCLNCGTAMCPDCCPSDYCPECQPAPVAPLVVLGGWSFADEGVEDDAVAVECAGCGDRIWTEDADEDACCAACRLPAPARRTCQMCAGILTANDDTRCAVCARFITQLDASHAAWKEDRIAA